MHGVYSGQDEGTRFSVWDTSMTEGRLVASARTQQWTGHRYAYTQKNPIKYRDASGHVVLIRFGGYPA